MIWICLLTQWALAAEPNAPPVLRAGLATRTEAEICAAALEDAHRDQQRQILQTVLWHDHQIDRALTRMREAGQLDGPGAEARLRAELVLGAALAGENLLTEAVYQVFKDRYQGKDAIRAALGSFRHIARAEAQGQLVGEVIERVLQYIPDVDTNNLAKIEATARFIGMNGDQLARFRATWMLYDNEDQFTPLLNDAIRTVLWTAGEEFVARVNDRAGLVRGIVRQWRTIAVPERPRPVPAPVTPRDVQTQDLQFFGDTALFGYLEQSSSAARRFFLGEQLKSLTDPQLASVLARRSEWWLKDSLVAAIENERSRRREIKLLYEDYARKNAAFKAVALVFKRKNAPRAYDARALERRLSGLRTLSRRGDLLGLSRDFISEAAATCDSKQFVHALVSLSEAVLPKFRGRGDLTLDLIVLAVKSANEVGVEEGAPAKKFVEIVNGFAGAAGPNGLRLAAPLVARLDPVPAKLSSLANEEIKSRYGRTREELRLASEALEQFERARD